MKTKLFLAALAVSFSMMSCTGNKTANTAADADSTAVETTVAPAQADSCCKGDTTACKKECDKKANCDKANCDKKDGCAEKKECCEKK